MTEYYYVKGVTGNIDGCGDDIEYVGMSKLCSPGTIDCSYVQVDLYTLAGKYPTTTIVDNFKLEHMSMRPDETNTVRFSGTVNGDPIFFIMHSANFGGSYDRKN